MQPEIAALPDRLLNEIEKVVVGQRDVLTSLLATVLSGGHVLLEDRPGVGKTVLARALASTLGLPAGRIQGTPDLLPTDITGVHVYQPNTGEWDFRSGPIFTSLLLFDELNRATPKAQSALLEAMAEGQVTADGHTFTMRNPFMVIATQNPLGEAGTYPLSSAQIDRFATMLRIGLPGLEAERNILLGGSGRAHLASIQPVLNEAYLQQLMAYIGRLDACEAIVDYVLAVVNGVRSADPNVWLSVRVSETLLAVSRGNAFMHKRDYVAPEDVQRAAPAVLAHRLPRSIDPMLVTEVIERLPVPANAH